MKNNESGLFFFKKNRYHPINYEWQNNYFIMEKNIIFRKKKIEFFLKGKSSLSKKHIWWDNFKLFLQLFILMIIMQKWNFYIFWK